MRKCIAFMLAIVSLSLAACGGGRGEVHVVNYTPNLHSFDIVDSYGVDTALSNQELFLNPYLYNGLFDVFWEVDSLENYRVNIRINDRRAINNSYLIYSEICGIGRACDQGGNVICEYTADYRLSCNNSNNPTDIGALFRTLPQDAYMFLEVCDLDSSYCVYDSYPVVME